MADKSKIPDNVINALIENTKVIDANTTVLNKINDKNEKETNKEENLVQKPIINSTLTNDEKIRYGNIGKELFKPFIISLEKLLRREKKRNEMVIKDDAKTVENSVKIQYENNSENKNEEGNSWLTILLSVLAAAGVAVFLFRDKISEFFTDAWDWIKDMFSSIGKFFGFDNKDNPINKILDACKSALEGLWSFVYDAFKKAGNFGSIIWEGIKKGWDAFITGPKGILNFGASIVKGLVDFALNPISWIADAIKDAIMKPIEMIFGSAEEDGKEAGEAAAQDVKATVSQVSTNQLAKTQAITDNTLFSAEKADQAIIETAKATRDAAKKRAEEQGLSVNVDGKVTDSSLREAAAKAGLDAFMQENNISGVDENEYNTLKEEFKKHISITGNTASINMQNLQKALSEKADSEANFLAPDSAFINALQDLKDSEGVEQMNKINGKVTAALQQGLQISADLQAAQNLENMSEEERFEARLRQAMNSGKSAEFRFMEGRKMILESTETIKSSFAEYDSKIRESFTGTWASFMTDFLGALKLQIETVAPQDNSKNTYNIMPLHKQSFGEMTNKMLKLAQENTEILIQQNIVLDKIKNLLTEPPPQKIVVESSKPNEIMNKANEGMNYVTQTAKEIAKDSFNAVSFWA
ncbi:MAG: hypothetical protein IJ341_12570 [Bacteroidales bacterium]|nr:hypothetical protein [Bacteroidales bacterium]